MRGDWVVVCELAEFVRSQLQTPQLCRHWESGMVRARVTGGPNILRAPNTGGVSTHHHLARCAAHTADRSSMISSHTKPVTSQKKAWHVRAKTSCAAGCTHCMTMVQLCNKRPACKRCGRPSGLGSRVPLRSPNRLYGWQATPDKTEGCLSTSQLL